MKLTRCERKRDGMRRLGCWIALAMVLLAGRMVGAQGVSTTTVQGTVYLANGQPGGGTLALSWRAFTTAAGQAIAADHLTLAIPADGFLSVNLAPNQGATPAGQYYTAVFYMQDGSTSTEYWVVPATAQATIGQVRAQVMPAVQAVQAASKTYVDQSIAQLSQSLLTASGGNLSGPLYLDGDPIQPLQAADKHYVDVQVATALPLSGGQLTGPLTLSSGAGQPASTTLSNTGDAQFNGNLQVGGTAQFPALAAGSGRDCLQIDASGVVTNTGAACGSGSGGATAWADIRSFGASIDGATPIDTALNSAIATLCPASGAGTSCSVLLPCGGSGCYLANGSSLSYSGAGNRILEIKLQGNLKLGSTLVLPDLVTLTGEGGGTLASFQFQGATAQISGPNAHGSMGTAIAATNTPVTFTPSFATGSLANLPVGSAITVAGTTSCTASVTRTSSTNAGNVTATCATTARIPVGAIIAVSGCSDPSLNLTSTPVVAADYPAKTITWTQTASATSATSCVITGFNDDSYETVQITAKSGSTLTATFAHTHSAADQWGEVGVMFAPNTFQHHEIDNVSVFGAAGMQLWAADIGELALIGDGFSAISQLMTAGAAELDSEWQGTIRSSSFSAIGNRACINNCNQPAYPYGLRCSQLPSSIAQVNGVGCSAMSLSDSAILGGIKIDSNGMTNNSCCWQSPSLHDDIIEEGNQAAITVDNRYISSVSKAQMLLDNVSLQDNFIGSAPYMIAYTDPGYQPIGVAHVVGLDPLASPNIVNKYFNGSIQAEAIIPGMVLPTGRGVPVGEYHQNGVIKAEIEGIGAGLGASLIPSATENVNTDPTTWTCSGCTVSVVNGPDGAASAGELLGSGNVTVWSRSLATHTGDMFLVGEWVRAGTNEKTVGSTWGGNDPYFLRTSGADTFSGDFIFNNTVLPAAFAPQFAGDGWHSQVMLTTVTSGDANTHTLSMTLMGGAAAGTGNQHFMPFVIYIPASANVPIDEAERWRQELLHGVVPPNMPGGGAILAMNKSYKLYWGNGTDLYRAADSSVKTDQQFDSANGYKVNGNSVIPSTVTGQTGAGTTLLTAGTAGTPLNPGVLATNTSMAGCAPGTYMKADGSGCSTPAGSGNVSGPGSATGGDLACWSGASGTALSDCGAPTPAGPAIVAKVALSSQTAAIATTPFYTVPADGTYRVTGFLYMMTAGTSGSIYAVANAGQYVGGAAPQYLSQSINVSSIFGYSSWSGTVHARAGSTFSYQTVFGSVVGSPAYGMDMVVERLQ